MKVSDTRKLPRRAVDVTVMGLGCAQMGNLYRVTPYEESKGAFDTAWESGMRYFDTAPFYGYTRSERRLGTMVTEHERNDYTLSTKVGRVMVPDETVGAEEDAYIAPLPFRPTYDYSYDGILRSFEASQQRLGVLKPDILYVHDIGSFTHGEKHQHYWEQLTTGGGFRALGKLREEGSTGAVGLGVNEWQIVSDAMDVFDIDVAMLAGRYTLLEQQSLAFMNRCAEGGVGIVVAGAFNSGILAGNRKFNYADAPADILTRVDALQGVCEELGVSLQAAALQFPLAHPASVTVVSGARNAQQLASNIEWFEQPIPDEFWSELHRRGLIAEGSPVPGGKA
ncbi:aldo/keto reductase [Agrobacterium sp. O3.4]|uniref:Aldo/keto reductase n=2 Tax=Rhizobium/Agrobacterium group TaxID=227290 RepID=A0A546XD00_RHIRH|nr:MULTISPECIES: aldo/keto reductase [Rhizobium/Agrobacterium group]MCZ7470726.1 aldo/keto reductase [Rhizobium rhizogenes]TRA98615.1 aldo/keto reductase [Rhizobium rhizogenes]WHO07922.1 aldo/keto reductase [Agrobacterium cucumeris]